MRRNTLTSSVMRGMLCLSMLALTGSLVRASTNHFNFDSDPLGEIAIFGEGDDGDNLALAGAWISTGGSPLELGADPSTNGYFALTQTTPNLSAHGQKAYAVFFDTDNYQTIVGFTLSCDVRVGAGNNSPADGFSVNFARAGDPVVLFTGVFGDGPQRNPKNAPEEGTQTGLVVSFDAYQNNSADIVGMTIKVDGIVLTNLAMPTRNGACDDITSLQTGPNTNNAVADLCWQPLWVNLDPSGLLNVNYKGFVLLTNYPAGFDPSAGQLVIAGRTGGSFQEQDVDNITLITIPSATPTVGHIVSSPYSWSFKIYDSADATPDTNTFAVMCDGVAVTPASITQSGYIGAGDGSGVTTVTYFSHTPLFEVGSQHTNTVHFALVGGGTVDEIRSFTVLPFNGSLDRVNEYVVQYVGFAQSGGSGSGRSGNAADYAVDIGYGGAKSGAVMQYDGGLLDDINQAFSNDVATVSVWVKYRTTGNYSLYDMSSPTAGGNKAWQLACPYGGGDSSTNYFDTGGDGAGQRHSLTFDSTTFAPYSGQASWWNDWHNIVATKNGTEKTLWIDGQQFMSVNDANPLLYDVDAIYMGERLQGGSINGWIDDFAVYSAELNGQQITNLANGMPPSQVDSSSLMAWWDFNEVPTPSSDFSLITFEFPPYTSGPLQGQDSWTVDHNQEVVLSASELTNTLTSLGLTPGVTVHDGDQALLIGDSGQGGGACVRSFTNFAGAKVVTVDVWMRPLTARNDAATNMGNLFMTVEDPAGAGGRTAGFRFGYDDDTEVPHIDYGTDVSGIWHNTGIPWTSNTWYHFTLLVNYNTKTYDFFLNDALVAANIAFWQGNTSSSLAGIRFYHGGENPGMIVDDLSIKDSSSAQVTFEDPPYTNDSLQGQDSWTVEHSQEVVLTSSELTNTLTSVGLTPGVTVHGGDQALLIGDFGEGGGACIRPFTNFDGATVVSVDVWMRPLTARNDAATNMGNLFMTVEDPAGFNGRTAGFRFGYDDDTEVPHIDYGTDITGIWHNTGIPWTSNTWYHFTLLVNYNTKTYDFYLNDALVAANIAFWQGNSSSSLAAIRFYHGGENPGMIVDDLSITDSTLSSLVPVIQKIGKVGDSVVVNFNGVLQSSANVDGPYVDVPQAPTTTYTNVISGPAVFFRARTP